MYTIHGGTLQLQCIMISSSRLMCTTTYNVVTHQTIALSDDDNNNNNTLAGRKLDPTPPLKSPALENRINITVSTAVRETRAGGRYKILLYRVRSTLDHIRLAFPGRLVHLARLEYYIILLYIIYSTHKQRTASCRVRRGLHVGTKMVLYVYDGRR